MIALNLITNLKHYVPIIRYQPATNHLLSRYMIDDRHGDIQSIHTIKRNKSSSSVDHEQKFQEFLKTEYSVPQSIRPYKLKPWSAFEDKDSKTTFIKSLPVSTSQENSVVKSEPNVSDNSCSLCRLNLKNLNYTDVLILDQFLDYNGNLITRKEARLCIKQYKLVKKLISQAHRCNLIKRPSDYFNPGPWHDLNTYIEPDRKRDQPMKVIKKQYWR